MQDLRLKNHVSSTVQLSSRHRRSQGGERGHAPQNFGKYSHFVL